MIQVYNNKSVCCGCGLCETVCPRNAIEMQMDEIGFKYQWASEDIDVPLMHEKRTGHVNSLTKEEWLKKR